MLKPPAETFPACFQQCRAQESPCYVHLCSGLATLPLSGAVAQVPPGCCSIWELSWLHSYQHVREVTQSSRVQGFMLQMECAVFLQECTSEVITLSVNSGELSTSNDRAIMCWPLPKIIQQLFQLFCHPKKTLFQFQLAVFFNHKSIYFQQDFFFKSSFTVFFPDSWLWQNPVNDVVLFSIHRLFLCSTTPRHS